MPDNYETMEIRIGPPSGAGYALALSYKQYQPAGMTLVIDQAALKRATNPDDYGRALGHMLFNAGRFGPDYAYAIGSAHGQREKLRLRLRLESPDLHALRWERIYYPVGAGQWRPMAGTGAFPFSRWVDAPRLQPFVPVVTRPLKLLVIVASPANLPDYQLAPIPESERQALYAVLRGIPEYDMTVLETQPGRPVTYKRIHQALQQGYDLVHWVSHGRLIGSETQLFLEQPDGSVDPVAGSRIVTLFSSLAAAPPFVFLMACESARTGPSSDFMPLGPALVAQGGVEAVIAMAETITFATARDFSEQFYRQLSQHGVVDRAVNEARAYVQGMWDASAPVLFMRTDDGRLLGKPPAPSIDAAAAVSQFSLSSAPSGGPWGGTTEERRLDAAMPQCTTVGRTTEVRALVALPESEGLKAHLPDYTEEGDEIRKEDVEGTNCVLTFTGGAVATYAIRLAMDASYFTVDEDEARRVVDVVQGQDTQSVIFLLTPQRSTSKTKVNVHLFDPAERARILATVTLTTEIRRRNTCSTSRWGLASTVRALLGGDTREVEPIGSDIRLLPAPPHGANAPRWNHQLSAEFHDCLLDAYDRNGLKRLLRYELDKELDELVAPAGLVDMVSDLIELARKEGWVVELVAAAHRVTPTNQRLADFAEKVRAAQMEPGGSAHSLGQRYLTEQEIDGLVAGGARLGLGSAAVRTLLFGNVNEGFYSMLTVHNSPRDQLQSDLQAMNKTRRLADGSVPLRDWLQAAVNRLQHGDATLLALFENALQAVDTGSNTR